MKKKYLFISFIFLVFFNSSCSNFDKKTFSTQVDSFLLESNFQGAVLISKGKKVLFSKGYGLCDYKDEKSPKITENTIFEVGSLTKQITASAILQLENRKKLSTNDKLSKYFPDYKYGEQITLEMLLNMRSGLTDCINNSEEFFPRNIHLQIEKCQLQNKPIENDIILKYLNDAPLFAKPDSTYFYCNTNYFLLAKIVEKVSGLSFSDYVQKNIFKKCKMTHSNFEFQQTDTKGYDYNGKYYSIPESLSFGCGNLNSSTSDLFKWNKAFFGGKIIPKKSLKKIINSSSYTSGFYKKQDMLFHGGTTNVFNSYNAYYLNSKLSIIVLTNQPINKTNSTFVAGKLYKIYQNLY